MAPPLATNRISCCAYRAKIEIGLRIKNELGLVKFREESSACGMIRKEYNGQDRDKDW